MRLDKKQAHKREVRNRDATVDTLIIINECARMGLTWKHQAYAMWAWPVTLLSLRPQFEGGLYC